MKQSEKIYMPVKKNNYVLDSREKPRLYVSEDSLKKNVNAKDYDDIVTYVREDKLRVDLEFDLNPLARLIAIKDFMSWCDKEDYNVSSVYALVKYEKYLKGDKNEYKRIND